MARTHRRQLHPLYLAQGATAKLLLAQNANVNVLDSNIRTPFGYLRLRNNRFRHMFQPTLETASVLLASGGRLAKFGASNLETFLKVLEVCQIDVTEDFKPELRGQAATP